MAHNDSLSELISIAERSNFDHQTVSSSGDEILGSDVPEERVLIPLALILSEQGGAATQVDINKVEEDSTTTSIHPGFNLASNETRVINLMDDGPVLPKLEGGTNIQGSSDGNDVEATLVWVHNIKD